MNKPVAGELDSIGLSLSLFSYNHFVKEPAAASTFTIVSDPDSADLPNGYCLDDKLIKLETQNSSNPEKWDSFYLPVHIPILWLMYETY